MQTPYIYKVGDIIAKSGAYNRKYRIVTITKQPKQDDDPEIVTNWVVEIRPLGSYYQDGRVVPVRKGTPSRDLYITGYGPELVFYFYMLDSGNYCKV